MTAAAPFRSGAGRVCLDFLRTLRYRNSDWPDQDEVAEPATLSAWIRSFGPWTATDTVEANSTHVTDARLLRDAIAELLEADRTTRGGVCLSAPLRRRLNTAAAVAPPAPNLRPSGEIVWTAEDPAASTLSLVARDALDLTASPLVQRLRHCANPECRVLFLDQSRPGARRWCSMGSCGNRAKKTRLRAATPVHSTE